MPFKKGQSGNPKGKPKGCKDKPKPLAARLAAIFGEVQEKDLKALVDRALTHALGDTIVTESLDGQKLSAKCVSDPRLFGIISKTVTDHEAKKQPVVFAFPAGFEESVRSSYASEELPSEPTA